MKRTSNSFSSMEEVSLNYEVLREFLDKKGQKVELSSGTIIVSGGDFQI